MFDICYYYRIVVILIPYSINNLQGMLRRMLQNLEYGMKKYVIKINVKKTEVMRINDEAIMKIRTYERRIDQAEK